MSYDEFWLENPFKVVAYRKAEKIRSEMEDHKMWIQGAYFYESLVNTSVLFRDLVKGSVKPKPYPVKPYGIKERVKSEDELAEEVANERLKAKIHFDMLFKQVGKRFNKAGEKDE
jgi:hypothetical protein